MKAEFYTYDTKRKKLKTREQIRAEREDRILSLLCIMLAVLAAIIVTIFSAWNDIGSRSGIH